MMFDIESLGSASGSVITQIGAVTFDIETAEIFNEFSVNIQIQDCLDRGLIVEGDNIKFWLNQPKEAMTFLKNAVSLPAALGQFREWYNFAMDNKKHDNIWAHMFDFVVLQSAYDVLKEGCPVGFRNRRCLRTLCELSGISREDAKEAAAKLGFSKTHDAIDDCRFQVAYASLAYNRIHNA